MKKLLLILLISGWVNAQQVCFDPTTPTMSVSGIDYEIIGDLSNQISETTFFYKAVWENDSRDRAINSYFSTTNLTSQNGFFTKNATTGWWIAIKLESGFDCPRNRGGQENLFQIGDTKYKLNRSGNCRNNWFHWFENVDGTREFENVGNYRAPWPETRTSLNGWLVIVYYPTSYEVFLNGNSVLVRSTTTDTGWNLSRSLRNIDSIFPNQTPSNFLIGEDLTNKSISAWMIGVGEFNNTSIREFNNNMKSYYHFSTSIQNRVTNAWRVGNGVILTEKGNVNFGITDTDYDISFVRN